MHCKGSHIGKSQSLFNKQNTLPYFPITKKARAYQSYPIFRVTTPARGARVSSPIQPEDKEQQQERRNILTQDSIRALGPRPRLSVRRRNPSRPHVGRPLVDQAWWTEKDEDTRSGRNENRRCFGGVGELVHSALRRWGETISASRESWAKVCEIIEES